MVISFAHSSLLLASILLLVSGVPRGAALAAGAINGASRQQTFLGKVAVAGATGRTGRYVVQELLDRKIPVVALVRNETKAQELFDSDEPLLEIISCDLLQREQVEAALRGCNAATWAASGISGPTPKKSAGWWQAIQQVFGKESTDASNTVSQPSVMDLTALPNICQCLLTQSTATAKVSAPQLVLLSSAGVTRLVWDEKLKAQLPGCADIPIVRLNPGNILNVKAETEAIVRKSGVRYTIVRPCGLNDKWPAGSRPVLSQGDVAVGRIHRKDVASVVVEALLSPEASGKTLEVLSLAGYPPAPNLDAAFARLMKDDEGPVSVDLIKTNYNTLQQLLPGERQDAAALAMGQTYEQLDRGQEGRLGKRGQERIERVPQTVA